MHELAITESVVEAVAERLGESRAAKVTLEIGRLSGVVPDSIRFCFEICAQGTALEGASLEIVQIPGRVLCGSCRREFETNDGIGLCACGSADLAFLSGRELRIRSVEVS
jgi:hydrogenase nickel incorporation protein HypA/HybF